jgi:hypothetical protein
VPSRRIGSLPRPASDFAWSDKRRPIWIRLPTNSRENRLIFNQLQRLLKMAGNPAQPNRAPARRCKPGQEARYPGVMDFRHFGDSPLVHRLRAPDELKAPVRIDEILEAFLRAGWERPAQPARWKAHALVFNRAVRVGNGHRRSAQVPRVPLHPARRRGCLLLNGSASHITALSGGF